MSSLRNSLHRRNHKERSQLAHRSRLGILEKHKDYVLRARDYHSKQDRINRLRQKAADRNKDEFYFGMNRQKTVGGVHVKDRGNEVLPVDIVKVLKSQDENYVRTMRIAGLKKIEKLKSQLSTLANLLGSSSPGEDDVQGLEESELEVLQEAGIIPGSSKPRRKKSSPVLRRKHILFAESADDAKELAAATRNAQGKRKAVPSGDAASAAGDEVDSGWKDPTGKKGKKALPQADVEEGMSGAAISADAKEHRSRLLKELSARLYRDRQLRYAERELEMQKLLMGKGTSKKLSGVEKIEDEDGDEDNDDDNVSSKIHKKADEKMWKPRVYKWKPERKR